MISEENEKRIIAACPSLFASIETERTAFSRRERFHSIAFGFECGNGWADLLVELCEKIQQHLNTLPKKVADSIVALQVKEKFGTLRFYLSHYEDTIEEFIREAERKSACTCEQCGKPGRVRGNAWYYTACNEHTREEDLNPIPENEMP